MESILNSIKEDLGIETEDIDYENQLIRLINMVFSDLNSIGVGPVDGFHITTSDDEWHDFLSDDILLNMVKTYVYECVKIEFDPPASSALLGSLKEETKKLEWKMYTYAEQHY